MSPTRCPRAWTTARITATSFPTLTTPATCGDLPNTMTRHMVIINYIYDLPFFKRQHESSAKAAGRLGNRRHRAIPDRHAVRHRHQQRLRGRRRVRQLRLRLGRPVLGSERMPVTINTGAFAGPVTNSRLGASISRPTYRSRPPAPSTCSRAFATPSTSPASRIGTSPCSRRSRSTSGMDSSSAPRRTTSSITRT